MGLPWRPKQSNNWTVLFLVAAQFFFFSVLVGVVVFEVLCAAFNLFF